MDNIKIENLNINGEGVSFVDNKKLCVKGVLKDEIVNVEILQTKENFILAKLKNICSPSPMRICPKCLFVDQCGGCDFMFVQSADGLAIKKQIMQEYFKDIFSGEIITNASKKDFASFR